jgi:hypothetical protein
LFDILEGGEQFFEVGLKKLLESEDVLKVNVISKQKFFLKERERPYLNLYSILNYFRYFMIVDGILTFSSTNIM